MVTSMLAVSAVVPSLLLVWYFHRRDLYPEPGRVIWTTFALGVATTPAVLLVEVPLSWLLGSIPGAHLAGFLAAFLTAMTTEIIGRSPKMSVRLTPRFCTSRTRPGQ